MTRRHEPSRRVDEPQAGYYRVRMIKGGPWVAAQVEQKLGIWSASINGVPCGAADFDPSRADGVFRVYLTGVSITKAEYDALVRSPPSSPRMPIDIGSIKPEF